jgi:hypothetical protein
MKYTKRTPKKKTKNKKQKTKEEHPKNPKEEFYIKPPTSCP